jgi:4-amino-4-deoxy-L-arabinose transferase-like glycosyltransferase
MHEAQSPAPAIDASDLASARAGTAPRPASRRFWMHLGLLAAMALAMYLFRLGAADWEDDLEAEGPQVIQEMLRGTGWILPLSNGRNIPLKPTLYHWLGAASAMLRHSGLDRVDARLPSALLATLCVVLVYLFARRHADEQSALWAGLILLTTPQFLIEARNSRVDMVMCGFLTAGLLLAHRAWEGSSSRATAIGAGVCIALATLAKGPLALALVVIVFAATALVARPAPGWRVLLSPATLAAALVPPVAWYAAATWQLGLPFLRVQLYGENMSRITGGLGYSPPWYYLAPLLAGGLPWILLLPWTAVGASRLAQRPRRFLSAWCIAMFVLFSASPGKRQAYLLPLRPALAILIGAWIAPQLARLRGASREARVPRPVLAALGGLVAAAVACVVALRLGAGGFGASQLAWGYWWRTYLDSHFTTVLALVAGVGVGMYAIALGLVRRRIEIAAYALAATLAWAMTLSVAAAAVVRGSGGSVEGFAHDVLAQLRPDERLAFFYTDDRQHLGLLFHLHRQLPVVEPLSEQAPCTPPQPGLYLIPVARWGELSCFRNGGWTEVLRGGPAIGAERNQWLVLARYGGETTPGAAP